MVWRGRLVFIIFMDLNPACRWSLSLNLFRLYYIMTYMTSRNHIYIYVPSFVFRHPPLFFWVQWYNKYLEFLTLLILFIGFHIPQVTLLLHYDSHGYVVLLYLSCVNICTSGSFCYASILFVTDVCCLLLIN